MGALVRLAAGPSSLAVTLRLMAGHDLVTEGFGPGQVGSSAMPHKTNMRTCERINGLAVVLSGYLAMAAALSGRQWNEGDVSDSVVRRVMIPDAFFACDGLLESLLHVLDGFRAFPAPIQAELDDHLQFLSASCLLTAAVRAGMGREQAHKVIQARSREAAAARRRGRSFDLWAALGRDPAFPFTREETAEIVRAASLAGRSAAQVESVAAEVAQAVGGYPEAAAYRPEPLL